MHSSSQYGLPLKSVAVIIFFLMMMTCARSDGGDLQPKNGRDPWMPFSAEIAKRTKIDTDKHSSRTSVHVFLPLRVQPLEVNVPQQLDAKNAAVAGFERLHNDLKQQRALYAPTSEHLDGIHDWLESHGESCVKHWDHVSCDQVPVSFVEKAFGTTMSLQVERSRPHVMHWMSDELEKEEDVVAKLPAHLQRSNDGREVHVFGVSRFDPTNQPRRRKVQHQNGKKEKETKRDTQPRKMIVTESSQPSSFSWPTQDNSTAPIILDVTLSGVTIQSVTVAVVCKKQDNSSVPAGESVWGDALHCPYATTSPTHLEFFLEGPYFADEQGGSGIDTRYAKHLHTDPLDLKLNASCMTAAHWKEELDNPNLYIDVAQNAVCRFGFSGFNFTSAFGPLTPHAKYKLHAKLIFQDGTRSPAAAFKNFFKGTFFDNPQGFRVGGKNGTIDFVPYAPNTPETIQELYNVPPPADPTGVEVEQGVIELSDVGANFAAGFDISDLDEFMHQLNIPFYSSSDLTIVAADSITQLYETTLDMELIMGISPGVKTTLLNLAYGGPKSSCKHYTCALLKALSDMAYGVYRTSVWSMSYGGPENGVNIPLFEERFRFITRSGISFVACTGDQGAGWANYYPLIAEFPATSPSVVGVGATSILHTAKEANSEKGTQRTNEIVCSTSDMNVITSGGGYSFAYALNATAETHDAKNQSDLMGQRDVVKEYTEKQRAALEAAGVDATWIDYQYPLNRHASPDVSALGSHLFTVIDGSVQDMFGTSASTPIIAAMITRINLERVRAHNSTMKVFNQFLYSAHKNDSTKAFFDVTSGSNCAGMSYGTISGNFMTYNDSECYVAGPGWDPVSGLGTVNFEAILPLALSWNPTVPVGKLPPRGNSSTHGSNKTNALHTTVIIVCCVVGTAVLILIVAVVFLKSRKRPQQSERLDSEPPAANAETSLVQDAV